MPKVAKPRQVGTSAINGVSVELFELDAKTKVKDKDGKETETKFTYQFPQFPDAATRDEVITALTYQNSKKETVDGWSVLLGYANTALKNEKRSAKLNEINGILKLREDPEAAINGMVEQMVTAYGVPREMAEANIRAMIAQGTFKLPGSETPAGA
jgi:hypothetical protein